MSSSILYICQNALGDIITTLPSIHFLRRQYPHATLDVCVNADFADLFLADHHITKVISAPSEWFCVAKDTVHTDVKLLAEFRPLYDVVVDSMCITQTANLIKKLRPAKAVGISFAETVHAYDMGLPLQDWHTWANGKRKATDCFADIVRLFSADYEDASPHLYVTKQAEQWAKEWIANRDRTGFPIVAINPGAGHPDKRWPMDDFLEVAKDLAKRDFAPLFIFGPKENELHQSCAAAIKNQGFLIYKSDNYQVQPLAGILRHCSMLITNDCAVMHIGAAIGCIVLAIFGPTNPDVWFPYSKPGQIAIGGSRPQKPSCPFPTVSEVQGVLNQISVKSAFAKTSCVET